MSEANQKVFRITGEPRKRNPFIVCICPTYKRPELLFNAMACFMLQDHENKLLIVLDDAGQFDHRISAFWDDEETMFISLKDGWNLHSYDKRIASLPEKMNELINLSHYYALPDIICVWEDDDIYLPNHLSRIADAWVPGEKQYFITSKVFSTYMQPIGDVQVEDAGGRFHSSWAYTKELLQDIGNYPVTDRLDFDMQMKQACLRSAGQATDYLPASEDIPVQPSFVYRWGNGLWHGSQSGEMGYKKLWDRIGEMEVEKYDHITPKLDDQTKKIYENLGVPVDNSKQHLYS